MARVLFIDDDLMTLETFARSMQLFGHQPLLAKTGEEGLKLAITQAPDLIFVDRILTDIDGLVLIRRFQEEAATAHIPVLMLSAGLEVDGLEEAKAAGAKDYLSKPVRLQTLLDVIEKYTEQ